MLVSAHSYGIKFYYKGEAKVMNIVKIDSPLPAVGDSQTVMGWIVLSGNAQLQNTVNLNVYRNDSEEDIVEMYECEPVYEEAPLTIEPPARGDVCVAVEFKIDMGGVLEMALVEQDTGIRHKLIPSIK